jgi:hypothetical protein
MARRVLAGVGRWPNQSRAGALRKGRSQCAGLAGVERVFVCSSCGGDRFLLWSRLRKRGALALLKFRRGQRLGCEGIYYMVKDLGRAAGMENFYRQRGRHTFASRLIENGMGVYHAMQLTRRCW